MGAGSDSDVPALHHPYAWPRLWQPIVDREPGAPNEIAFDRHRLLLILSRELQTADLNPYVLQCFRALTFRMKEVFWFAQLHLAAAERDFVVLEGDRRKGQMVPSSHL